MIKRKGRFKLEERVSRIIFELIKRELKKNHANQKPKIMQIKKVDFKSKNNVNMGGEQGAQVKKRLTTVWHFEIASSNCIGHVGKYK